MIIKESKFFGLYVLRWSNWQVIKCKKNRRERFIDNSNVFDYNYSLFSKIFK